MNRQRKTSPPPYFWKVPVAEKDHMTENYRRMKNIAVEGQKRRHEPLKANFIPGVTKNSKYAHVQSRVGAILKGEPKQSLSDELLNRRLQVSDKFNGNGQRSSAPPRQRSGAFGGGPSRLSRSTTDLTSRSQQQDNYRSIKNSTPLPLRRQQSINSALDKPPQVQARQSASCLQILNPNPPDESIYKWKFNEDQQFVVKNDDGSSTQHPPAHQPPSSQCHRVEYLPCDGICADIVEPEPPNSARSNSSRTSRGCNTEETRIFAESSKPKIQPPFHYRSLSIGTEEAPQQLLLEPKNRGINTINGFHHTESSSGLGIGDHVEKFDNKRTFSEIANRSSQKYNIVTNGDLESKMKDLNIRNNRGPEYQNQKKNGNSNGQEFGAGDLPHSLGTVPKYLKQRQEEWRVEEVAKKEAEKNAQIPPGYMLMSENERLETLKSFKNNYDSLIGELNRIPIRIDTMRVRNHKVDLEKQLTRLEDAMKTFSRPKVWVKVND